jgi:hypothetical protein
MSTIGDWPYRTGDKWPLNNIGTTYYGIPVNAGPQQGWQCPLCRRVNAPWLAQCTCGPQNYRAYHTNTTAITVTGEPAYDAIPVTTDGCTDNETTEHPLSDWMQTRGRSGPVSSFDGQPPTVGVGE